MHNNAVTLEPVTEANLAAVRALRMTDEQRAYMDTPDLGDFLADAPMHPTFTPYAALRDGTVVGLVSFGHLPESPARGWISLIAIGGEFQGRGSGRAAMEAAIEMARGHHESIGLAYKPLNVVAERLYLSLGFRPTGSIDERGEIELRLPLR